MPRIELNCRAVCRLITLLVAILATADARGQTAGSAPPLVIRGPENAAQTEAQREAAEGIVAESELAMGRRFDPSHRARIRRSARLEAGGRVRLASGRGSHEHARRHELRSRLHAGDALPRLRHQDSGGDVAAPVASPGVSSATTMTVIGLQGSLRWQFGCHVSTAGDFLGDELTGAVSWVCR